MSDLIALPVNTLSIEVDAKTGDVDYVSFFKFQGEIGRLLKIIEREMHGSSRIKWRVHDIQRSNPYRTVLYATSKGGRLKHQGVGLALRNGFRTLETSVEPPQYFNDEALDITKKAMMHLSNGFKSVSFADLRNEDKVHPTLQTLVNIEKLKQLSTQIHYEWSTITGKIESLDIHDAEDQSFGIWHALTGQPIECLFGSEHRDKVIKNIDKRVSVHGRLKYDRYGVPKEIEVSEITEIPPTRFQDIKPLNITNGENTAEFIRKQRNG